MQSLIVNFEANTLPMAPSNDRCGYPSHRPFKNPSLQHVIPPTILQRQTEHGKQTNSEQTSRVLDGVGADSSSSGWGTGLGRRRSGRASFIVAGGSRRAGTRGGRWELVRILNLLLSTFDLLALELSILVIGVCLDALFLLFAAEVGRHRLEVVGHFRNSAVGAGAVPFESCLNAD